MSEMIAIDLKAADITYKTVDGFADFHAAGRHTYITKLLRNGTSLPEVMELARHSEIGMTMRYTHIGIDDQAKAVMNLPSINIDKTPATLRVSKKSGSLHFRRP